jgi:hypothetical protein
LVNVFSANGRIFSIDCPAGAFLDGLVWTSAATNTTTRLRNVTVTNLGANHAIEFDSSGTLILENCVFEASNTTLLDIEPTGHLNLVIRNSRISSGGGGILLKPQTGGSINATFDHVTIADNTGGGIKLDTNNGLVTLDITDSNISNSGGNGINVVSGAAQGIVSVEHSVIARNGVAGIQANGFAAGVLVSNTTLDENTSGALSVVSGGRISTYGNNRIVGSAGSGFTGTVGLQ